MSTPVALPLQGRRILIVEDQMIVAMAVNDMLVDMGATIVGPALTLQSGYDMALTAEIDVAVLDLWLNGERSYAIGEVLHQRGIPFLLTSVADRGAEPPGFATVPRIMKPFSSDELSNALIAALGLKTAA